MLHFQTFTSVASVLFVWLSVSLVSANQKKFALQRSVVGAKIPKPLSDHTAVVGDDNLIYLAGGCDAKNGNVFDKNSSVFVCSSISSSFYSFNPNTTKFSTLSDMPSQRYRHAAVAINSQIWLVGGRHGNDTLISDVDVYDFATSEWKTYKLPDKYVRSDQASFRTATHAVFAGGYDVTYGAHNTVFSIDPSASTDSGSLVITDNEPLLEARGDCAGTSDLGVGYGYISGGFTDANKFCAPLGSVERFSFSDDSWKSIAPLPTARADEALVTIHGSVVAMGGERQPENICSVDNPKPGDLAVAVDDVEQLSEANDKWDILTSLPQDRFRFAAAVYNNTVYTFGGQIEFEADCVCHKTTDEVVMYEAVLTDDNSQNQSDNSGSNGGSAAFSFQNLSGLVMFLFGFLWAL